MMENKNKRNLREQKVQNQAVKQVKKKKENKDLEIWMHLQA